MLYDYKSDEFVQDVILEDVKTLVDDISDKFDTIKDAFGDISIIAKYESAKEIIAELVCIGYPLVSIEFEKPDWGNYYDEYLISLNFDGIWCEKFRRDSGYLTDESTITYILDDCSSKVISKCKSEMVYEVCIEECDEDECSKCCCDESTDLDTNESETTYVSRDKNGTPLGFSKTWSTEEDGVHCYSSYSHYSNNLSMLKEIASDFGVRL